MQTISLPDITHFSEIFGSVIRTGKPVEITDTDYSAVLVPSEEWKAIQETLYLLSIPGMQKDKKEYSSNVISQRQILWAENHAYNIEKQISVPKDFPSAEYLVREDRDR